ncbi:ABC transporter substrate-binding protein [Pelagibacterium halotolerans]|uniref:ABC transporter substrate-binding protein n=1 Tax=Pelagibacterium halotolerans TaxID=531813 RepID=UPI00384C63BC
MKLAMLTGNIALSVLAIGAASAAMADTLNVQLSSDIRSSQPGINRDAITDSVMLNVVEGLVAAGEGGDIQPMLAESWAVSDDRTVYTFTLRDDVVFHNGAPLTAEDVKWSWEKLLSNPDYNCNVFFDGSRGTQIVGIDILDTHTVAFELNAPDEMLLTYMAQPQCGAAAIVHRDSFNEDGTWDRPIGTGPFVFDEWTRGESVHLVKFEDYALTGTGIDGYGGRKEVLVDDVNLVVVPDNSAAVAGLRSGDLDILPYVPPSEAAELAGDDAFQLVSEPHGGLVTMLFQTQDPVMSHPAMRKAFATALDVPQIVDAVMYGLGVPNNSLVATGSLYHTEHHDQGYEYNPAAVPALLEEAGYNGEEITILTNRRSAISYDVAVIAQAMLQAAGINSKIEVLEWASQLDRFRSGNYQVMAFNYSNRADPALAYNAVTASKEERANAIWDNPEAIALLNAVLQEPEQAERQELFDRLHTLFLEDVPLLMLANGLDVGVAADNVTGYRTWHGFARLWGVGLTE